MREHPDAVHVSGGIHARHVRSHPRIRDNRPPLDIHADFFEIQPRRVRHDANREQNFVGVRRMFLPLRVGKKDRPAAHARHFGRQMKRHALFAHFALQHPGDFGINHRQRFVKHFDDRDLRSQCAEK